MATTLSLEQLYGEVIPDLGRVEAEIQGTLHDDRAAIRSMTAHTARYGGKRLRPALVLLMARACGTVTASHATLGAVVELIHLATLVHDDVIDEADVRRRQATVSALHGNYEAVLLGDMIFARAIHRLATLGDQRSLLALTQAVSRLCSGEILQNRHRRDVQLSESAYYEIIEGKTAILYAVAAELAAHLSLASERVIKAASTFGRELGVAFQIVDDCLDLSGDEKVVGKSLGTDLKNGKMTLPLILMRDARDADASSILALIAEEGGLDDAAAARVAAKLRTGGYLDAALARAADHVRQGCDALRAEIPESRCGVLLTVAEYVISRRH